jgi:hypothetical protein
MDNASVDAEGHVWVAGTLPLFYSDAIVLLIVLPITGFPKALVLVYEHFANPTKVASPSTAFRFSINTGPNSFYGQKFKIDRVCERSSTLFPLLAPILHGGQAAVLHIVLCVNPPGCLPSFQLTQVFEDDGSLASGVTSVAYDTERNRLFMHGKNAFCS